MTTDPHTSSKKTIDCSFNDFYTIEVCFTETPKPKRQIEVLEILQSPFFSSVKRDLFSQLLGTERKDEKELIMLGRSATKREMEVEIDFEEEEVSLESKECSNEEESSQENEEVEMKRPCFDDENRMDSGRRRRRKNNLQLKILQHEFEKRQGEWNKNEIVQMAELTGLSEGQVYKWCWDQRKKSTGCTAVKQVKDNWNENLSPNANCSALERTKLISKKSVALRTARRELEDFKMGTLRKRL